MNTSAFINDTEITEAIRAIKVSGNAKQVFEALAMDVHTSAMGANDCSFDAGADIILHEVAANGTGFKKDIAAKALKYGSMSDKQRWCVAFDFIAINKLSF